MQGAFPAKFIAILLAAHMLFCAGAPVFAQRRFPARFLDDPVPRISLETVVGSFPMNTAMSLNFMRRSTLVQYRSGRKELNENVYLPWGLLSPQRAFQLFYRNFVQR